MLVQPVPEDLNGLLRKIPPAFPLPAAPRAGRQIQRGIHAVLVICLAPWQHHQTCTGEPTWGKGQCMRAGQRGMCILLWQPACCQSPSQSAAAVYQTESCLGGSWCVRSKLSSSAMWFIHRAKGGCEEEGEREGWKGGRHKGCSGAVSVIKPASTNTNQAYSTDRAHLACSDK